MSSERYEQLRELFLQAYDLPSDQRDAFVERLRHTDDALAEELQALLSEHDAVPSWSSLGTNAAAVVTSVRLTPGTIVAGRYRVIRCLGRGGMGEVYRTHDLRLHVDVAMKVLVGDKPDAVRSAMLLQEVTIAREVTHPNVCRVYDVGDADGAPFITMEYVQGHTLSSLLRKQRPIPADRAVQITREIIAGLAAAHHASVLHRDLKPANILIDAHGHVRITDFGLALRHAAEEGSTSVAPAGTPPYMAPELLARGEASVQSDLFALGCVVTEMFTGSRPTPSQRPELPAAVPPRARQLIAACLESDPARRPRDLQPLIEAFAPPRRTAQSRLTALLAGVVIIAAALGVLVTATRPAAQPPPPPPVNLFPAGNMEGLVDGWPRGWSRNPAVTLEHDNGNHFLRLTAAQPQRVGVDARCPLPAGATGVVVRGRCRVSHFQPETETWKRPTVRLALFDAAGAPVSVGDYVAEVGFSGDLEWTPISVAVPVPPHTASVQFIGLLQSCAATMDLDDVQVHEIARGSADAPLAEPQQWLNQALTFVPSIDAARPAGWTVADAVRFQLLNDAGHSVLRISSDRPAQTLAQRWLRLPEQPAPLRLSIRMRGSGLRAHDRPVPNAGLAIDFADERLKLMAPRGPELKLRGDQDWTVMQTRLTPPRDARYLRLELGLYGTLGTVDVQEIRLVPEAAPPPQRIHP